MTETQRRPRPGRDTIRIPNHALDRYVQRITHAGEFDHLDGCRAHCCAACADLRASLATLVDESTRAEVRARLDCAVEERAFRNDEALLERIHARHGFDCNTTLFRDGDAVFVVASNDEGRALVTCLPATELYISRLRLTVRPAYPRGARPALQLAAAL